MEVIISSQRRLSANIYEKTVHVCTSVNVEHSEENLSIFLTQSPDVPTSASESPVCSCTLNLTSLLAYGKTPSKSFKAEGFLTLIVFICSLLEIYDVSMQALS